ncbi:IQ motif-containing protein H isoform X3 [Cephus cinctus]|uniref:IQ motif-containing protein H isoform X3 n=1 Tax=Cephus cinctus TaxID=211228 RepID=A0AAJ7RFK1_CEPCN|nr:IQ motif-containing protein H isoform X3 [Cephus cinctus]
MQGLKSPCGSMFGQDYRNHGKFCSCGRIICTANSCETRYIPCFKNNEESEFELTGDKISCEFKSPCKSIEDASCMVSRSLNIEPAEYVCKKSLESRSGCSERTCANSDESEHQGICENNRNDESNLKISTLDQTAFQCSSSYTEDDIKEFARIIEEKLNEELARNTMTNVSEPSRSTMNELCYLCGRGDIDHSDICSTISGGHDTYHFGVFSDLESQEVCESAEGLECQMQPEVTDSPVCAHVESVDEKEVDHIEKSICEQIVKICKRRQPVLLDHQENYILHPTFSLSSLKPFKIGDVGVSHEISKWGKCHDIVDKVLYQRDVRLSEMVKLLKETSSADKNGTCVHFLKNMEGYLLTNLHKYDESYSQIEKCCKRDDERNGKNICNAWSHVCRVRSDDVCVTGDNFDDLNRFKDILEYGCAQLCRRLVEWFSECCIIEKIFLLDYQLIYLYRCHRLSKTWNFIREHPHVVVHLPSLGYPDDLINRAGSAFDLVQNIQVSRIAWLENENCQVLYVCPSIERPDIIEILYNLIKNVRPDISTSRLWIVPIQEEYSNRHTKKKFKSGSDNLFCSPRSYRKVRYLTAGRRAFLLPGLMQEVDVCIACELRMPVMGAAVKFQRYFSNKSNVAQFLMENGFGQPPFVTGINNFHELCKGLASTMLAFPSQKKWLVKINIGFNGYQTAVLNFNKGPVSRAIKVKKHMYNYDEEDLTCLLIKHLPTELQLNKRIYKNYQEFINDLETYGGIVQGCPANKYHGVSLGVFIEHDTALPVLKGTADVIQLKSDMTTDIGYSIPQSTISLDILETLAINVGKALQNEQLMGYFGLDVIIFTNQCNIQEVWIVDIDPYYTDLLGYTDWIKFCLGNCKCCCVSRKNEAEKLNKEMSAGPINGGRMKLISKEKEGRYTVCSGKLYSDGLRKYCTPTLVRLCRQHQVFYDHKTKRGCIVYPTDSERRAISVISIYPSREMAMRKFIEALRTLHEELARDLEKEFGVV